MSVLIPYLGKMLVYSGVFAAYYLLFMRRESFIRWNRWYIMAAMVLSVLLPLVEVTITTYYEAVPVGNTVLNEVFPYIPDNTISYAVLIRYILLSLYALVFILLMVAGINGMLRINRLKKTNIFQYLNIARLYCCKQKIAPFSFFKNVFIPDTIPLDSSEGQQILRHELEHVHARHSVDKVLSQLLCTVFWFNPFFWFFKKEQSLVHEFMADRACVKNGGAKELSRLILCTLYPMQHAYFGNQFFQSPIKRRLTMIAKNKTNHSSWRKLLVLPVVLACLCVFAINVESKPIPAPEPQTVLVDEPQPDPAPQPQQRTSTDEVILYENVQTKPLFQGGDADDFAKWATSQIVYPVDAMTKGIQGKVVLQFVIGKDGKLEDIKVLKSVDPLLDQEAIRVVSSSPAWIPGRQDGKAVRVAYTFPVNYTLVGDDAITMTSSTIDTTITITAAPHSQDERNDNGSYRYETVQVKPLFQGGDAEGFSKWVTSQIVYPVEAMTKDIQGRVVLQFVIDKDGKLGNIRVLRGVDPLLDQEAIRVVSLSPAWTPAKHDGKNVQVIYTFPVNFTLAKKTMPIKKYRSTRVVKDVYQLNEVDKEPRFGGEYGNRLFAQWASRNITLPEKPSKNEPQKKATVRFIVTKDGDVKNVELAESSGNKTFDEAVLNVVKKSPKWQPAAYKDRKVDVIKSFTMTDSRG